MTTTIKTLIRKSKMSIPRLALTGILAGAVMLLAADRDATNEIEQSHDHMSAVPARLVEIVRIATQQFTDVNAATAAELPAVVWLRQRSGSGGNGRALYQPRAVWRR